MRVDVRYVGLAAALAVAASAVRAPAEDAPAASGKVALADFFKGKLVRATPKGEIELAYDFEDAAQLDDFEITCPFRAIVTTKRAVEQGRLRLEGTGSLRHKAVFGERVGGEASFTPMRTRDFGFAVSEQRESEVFTLYCVQDQYFSRGDGVFTPQNMVIKFIPRDPKVNKDGMQDWRYCGSRGPKPDIQRGVALSLRIERGDNQSEMWMEGFHSKGKEAGRDLTSQMLALYTYDSDVKVDDLIVRGVLSPEYVAAHNLDLNVPEPATEEPAATDPGIDPALAARVREQVAAYPATTKAPEMARLLRDTAVPEALRAEAVERIVAVADKRIVPLLIDGLYSEEEASRRLANDVVKALVPRNFGFKSDAPEDKRRKAITALNEYIRKNAAQFQ